ncbi:MAG: hypothetical protein JWN95_518 [Frankiales bacterium]|nr:hypothetical protein [Frankiales bacterium]
MTVAGSTPRRVIDTASGPAWADIDVAPVSGRPGGEQPKTLLVIGHGAGGSVEAADLLAVRRHCLAAGISVARVTQPYRVAGKKAPPAAATLDGAWLAVIAALRTDFAEHQFVYAGRSSGARVACRTAVLDSVGAPVAVVAIAFPVHPPGQPVKSRLSELDAVGVPVLVVQGERDPFGQPPRRRGRKVVLVPGDHSLKASADQVGVTVARWLATVTERAKVGP